MSALVLAALMPTWAYIVIGVAAYGAVGTFAWGICKSAGQGDERMGLK